MEENVLINMKSVQSVYDDRTETELVTSGRMTISDGLYSISYDDSEATGFPGSTTNIVVRGSEYASVSRTGATVSDLVMETGKKHHCHYETPYGTMNIGVYTHVIENFLEEKGTIYMQYTIDINSGYISDNEIILKIKRDTKG